MSEVPTHVRCRVYHWIAQVSGSRGERKRESKREREIETYRERESATARERARARQRGGAYLILVKYRWADLDGGRGVLGEVGQRPRVRDQPCAHRLAHQG